MVRPACKPAIWREIWYVWYILKLSLVFHCIVLYFYALSVSPPSSLSHATVSLWPLNLEIILHNCRCKAALKYCIVHKSGVLVGGWVVRREGQTGFICLCYECSYTHFPLSVFWNIVPRRWSCCCCVSENETEIVDKLSYLTIGIQILFCKWDHLF